MKQTTCLFILAIAVILGAAHASGVVRGVKPSAQHLYKGTHIECDGGKKVPIGRVNDDFCDCADGADEPGTSACSNGKFFCINEGFRGLSIPSSWLADGHCDCCDGSDEAAGKCANTCKEQAKAHESSVASEIGLQERGLRQREAYIAHARTERDRHAKLITEAEKKLATLETKVAELERVKVAAEDAYSAAFDEAEAKINAEYEEKEAKQAEAEKELPEGADNLATHQKEQRPNPDEDPIVAPLKDVKEKATNDWSEAKNERDAASRELEGFRKFMNLDFGSDLAYHGLYGTTYEFIDKEYTYKLNAFTDVQQTKPGHSSNLGRWKNWDENKSNVMIYDSGDRCWGAPDRSTRVTLICGDENKIIDVQEPNKCEYAIKMRTPAACSKADLDALRHGE